MSTRDKAAATKAGETLFPVGFLKGPLWERGVAVTLDRVACCSDAASLRLTLANLEILRAFWNPDFEPVLDEIQKSGGEFASLWTETIPQIVKLAKRAPEVFQDGGPNLLSPVIGKGESSIILSREQVAVLLALAFLAVIPPKAGELDSSRASMAPLVWPKEGCAFPPNVEKLKCFLHYFNTTIECDDNKLAENTADDDTFIELERFRLDAPDAEMFVSLEHGWGTSTIPLRNITIMPLFEPLDQSKAPIHVDFSNASVGGGVFLNAPGATAQEEILFATHPELCAATILAQEPLLNDEVLLARGARRISRHEGYSDTFRYAGPADSSFITKEEEGRKYIPRVHVAMDASRYDSSGVDRPRTLDHARQIRDAARDLRKALSGFRAAVRHIERHTSLNTRVVVATGNWGSGAFGGAAVVKALLQWMAASVAGVELEYFPWDDRILAEMLPPIVATALRSQVTVGMLMNVLLGVADDASEEPHGRFCDDGVAFLTAVSTRLETMGPEDGKTTDIA